MHSNLASSRLKKVKVFLISSKFSDLQNYLQLERHNEMSVTNNKTNTKEATIKKNATRITGEGNDWQGTLRKTLTDYN